MKSTTKKIFYVALILLLLAGSFLAGSWYSQRSTPKGNFAAVKSVAVNTDKRSDGDTGTSSLPPGTVKIMPEKQQFIGLRIGQVEKTSVNHVIRTLGRVAADETRIYRVNASVDGWVRETYNNSTGSLVKKDEILATFYSPEFLGAEQAYIYALSSLGRFQASGKETPEQISLTKLNVQQYKNSLRNLGMGEVQIEEIGRTRQYTENIHITSPVTGFVLSRNVSPGERFEKSKELYKIADLRRVWILADVFESEAEYFKPGVKVKFTLPHQKKTFSARVSDVLPQFDATTRTLKVRLEADNPGYVLKPDMFVDVEFPVQLPPAVTIPVDAVLDSGIRKTVFVDRGNGFFEPREVETGWRIGNRVEIIKGLDPGERIVISGNFLIDSESKMEMAAAGIQGNLSKDPVCGRDISLKTAEKAGRKISYGGKTYYFCSDECKKRFEKESNRYLRQ